jgi:hypothetical protein
MSKVKINNGNILTYRFNQRLFLEIETLTTELLARLKTNEECQHLIFAIIRKQNALERGKSISRGKAIAKAKRFSRTQQLITSGE